MNPVDADATNTLIDSPDVQQFAKYWNGTASVNRLSRIFHDMLNTSPQSQFTFQIAGTDVCYIRDDATMRGIKNLKAVFVANSLGAISAGYTYRYALTGETARVTESDVQAPIPRSGTFKNLYVSVIYNTTNGFTTISLRKNGSSVLSVTVGAGETGTFSNTTDSVDVTEGDLVNFQISNGATSGSINIATISIEFE